MAYPLQVARWKKSARQTRVKELLEYVGLSHLADRYPEQLSGGQKQRVGIARALAASPSILLADEATSALDPDTTRDVLHLLQKINQDLGLTIIVVTHHMSVVREICHSVTVLSGGKIVEQASVYDFFSAPQSGVSRSFLPQLSTAESDEYIVDIRSNPHWLEILNQHRAIEFCILQARIDQLEGKTYGSVRIALTGDSESISQLKAQLDAGIQENGHE